MQLMLVYRFLRQISEWTLSDFYTEVYVQGTDNVPLDGPVLLLASHPNETIDVAALSVTVRGRRQLSFWAKAGLFKNPLSRFLMESSGSVPVYRNSNGASGSANEKPTSTSSSNGSASSKGSVSTNSSASRNGSLFSSTISNLSEGGVICLFPEGTCCSVPRVLQIKEGAARAALEYVKMEKERASSKQGQLKTNLVLAPVGILYTDKAKYLSRIFIQYGNPIPIDDHVKAYMDKSNISEELAARAFVAQLTSDIWKEMQRLTINAPDWNTFYVAEIAREILWQTDNNVPLKSWFDVTHTLVDLFSQRNVERPKSLDAAHASLLTYSALLYHAGIHHGDLTRVAPLNRPRTIITQYPLSRLAFYLAAVFLHPRFLVFLPVLILHVPAYLIGSFAALKLADEGFEESVAQFKVIFGGIGAGLTYAGVVYAVLSSLRSTGVSGATASPAAKAVGLLGDALRLTDGSQGWAGRARGLITTATLAYALTWGLAKWHTRLVPGNYKSYKLFITSLKVFIGLRLPASASVPADRLGGFARRPEPPRNPWIKYPTLEHDTHPSSNGHADGNGHGNSNGHANGSSKVTGEPAFSPTSSSFTQVKLVRAVLAARAEAVSSLATLFHETNSVRQNGPSSDTWKEVLRRGGFLAKAVVS